jgi:twitching motility protein PilT
MVVTPAIGNLIREGKTHMIANALETGSKFGMITLDKALIELVKAGLVSVEDACAKANNPELVRAGKAPTSSAVSY